MVLRSGRLGSDCDPAPAVLSSPGASRSSSRGRPSIRRSTRLRCTSTPYSGFVPCPGGPFVGADAGGKERTAGGRCRSPRSIQTRLAMEAFSPYPQEVRPSGMRVVDGPVILAFRPAAADAAAGPARTGSLCRGLVKLEPENFARVALTSSPGVPARPLAMRSFAYSVKRAGMSVSVGPPSQLFDDPTIVDLEVLDASEQALGQLLAPPGMGPDWIRHHGSRAPRSPWAAGQPVFRARRSRRWRSCRSRVRGRASMSAVATSARTRSSSCSGLTRPMGRFEPMAPRACRRRSGIRGSTGAGPGGSTSRAGSR